MQRQLQQAQMVSDISSQVLDIYNMQEAIHATRQATKDMQDAGLRQKTEDTARKELQQAQKADPTVRTDAAAVTQRAYQDRYNQALAASQARTGDPMRQAVTASVAVLSGLAGGDIKAALATGLKQVTGQDNPSDE
ncbi:hypothetical protein DOA20_24695, partial [Salmonella enterica subsp. enterica serovar Newport]|nr:hypothetical protein [Salmonella enterica subsp. enterica serovar Newport]